MTPLYRERVSRRRAPWVYCRRMSGPRTVVIVNPRSQNGALGRRWAALARELRREVGAFEDVLTRAPGDATRLAREALDDGAEIVVAVGGDGTVNEVANGFFDAEGTAVHPEAALGFLPFGTGGDFRKSVGIPREFGPAARVLSTARRRAIDVGHLRYTAADGSEAGRVFVNIASFGMSGVVNEYVNSTTKAFGGTVSFLLATARAGLRYRNQRVRLVFDGDEAAGIDRTISTVAVANGRYFGGGMKVAPDAELDDGAFDVVVLGDLGALDMAMNGPRLYAGTHLQLDKIELRRARELRATPLGRDPVRLDVDGETPGCLPASFRLLPRALTLMVPA